MVPSIRLTSIIINHIIVWSYIVCINRIKNILTYIINIMTIIDDYLTLQRDYSIKYGKKTVVIMEIGTFYEMYGIRENDILQSIKIFNSILLKNQLNNKIY